MLVDITRGWDYLSDNREDIITSYTGEVTHFPLSCSTGVLNNLTANKLHDNDKVTWDDPAPGKNQIYNPDGKNLKQMLRDTARNPFYIWPRETAAWLALALIYDKFKNGCDDGGDCGYTGFKVAQFVLADRINEDKRNGKRFNSYNTTFSCDDLMDYLDQRERLGETLVSTPREGAHEARCRAAIYTPSMEDLETFISEKTAMVREHIISTNKYLEPKVNQKIEEAPLW